MSRTEKGCLAPCPTIFLRARRPGSGILTLQRLSKEGVQYSSTDNSGRGVHHDWIICLLRKEAAKRGWAELARWHSPCPHTVASRIAPRELQFATSNLQHPICHICREEI